MKSILLGNGNDANIKWLACANHLNKIQKK